MSRIGNRPIKIEEGVKVEPDKNKVIVSAGENKMELPIPFGISVAVSDGFVQVSRQNSERDLRAKHGLIARLLKNMITGVTSGFSKNLEFTGTGYRAQVSGNELILNMGYSHEVKLTIPENLKVAVVKNTINISGAEKDRVGQFAALARQVRPPEVYKGKGIKYKGEFIKRKAGKTAASK